MDKNYKVPFITGDGVGEEITPSMQAIVNAAVRKLMVDNGIKLNGWKCWQENVLLTKGGSWLPDETMEAFRNYQVGIKGPLTTPVGGGIRSLNVALRQTLDLVCLPSSGALV